MHYSMSGAHSRGRGNNHLFSYISRQEMWNHQKDELRKWPQNTQISQTKPFTLHTFRPTKLLLFNKTTKKNIFYDYFMC